MAWQWVQSFFLWLRIFVHKFFGLDAKFISANIFLNYSSPCVSPRALCCFMKKVASSKIKNHSSQSARAIFFGAPVWITQCVHARTGKGILSQTECAASGPASMVRTRQGLNYYLIIICKKVVQAVSLGPAPLNVTINSGTFFAVFLFKGEENEEKMKENYVWHEGGRHSRHRGHRGVGPPPLPQLMRGSDVLMFVHALPSQASGSSALAARVEALRPMARGGEARGRNQCLQKGN